MTPELRNHCREAVHVVRADGVVYSAGMACAFVLRQIGYPRLGAMMMWPALRPIVEWGYRRVARNRDWIGRLLFGKNCKL
jgi:predicted DCC family thiol-disulfide oxidoreductase YuxK